MQNHSHENEFDLHENEPVPAPINLGSSCDRAPVRQQPWTGM